MQIQKLNYLYQEITFSPRYRYLKQVGNILERPNLWLKKDNTAIFVYGLLIKKSYVGKGKLTNPRKQEKNQTYLFDIEMEETLPD